MLGASVGRGQRSRWRSARWPCSGDGEPRPASRQKTDRGTGAHLMWALGVCGIGAMLLVMRWQRSGLAWFEFVEQETIHAFARLWHRCTSDARDPLPATGPAI